MHESISSVVDALISNSEVNAEMSAKAFGPLLDGSADPIDISALLVALAVRGETAAVLAGAATVLRQHATKISPTSPGLLDTCGTGGDKLHTFNISTATAIVAAACGVPVAKHGNRSVSSSSGSADVLESLGVNLDLSPERVADCVDTVGIGFLYARQLHPAMKHVGPIRAQLGIRTVFNLLGPLANPANAQFHLLGTGRYETAEVLAAAVSEIGVQAGGRTVVVCGNDQLDEVSLWGTTRWIAIENEGTQTGEWTPESFELSAIDVNDLKVESAEESAAVISSIFAGTPSPAADMVIANAAAALWACGKASDVAAGVTIARNSISSGACDRVLSALAKTSQQ